MHTLSRQVRFSITPFAETQPAGFNGYASKPCGEGLSLYLALWVDLTSTLNPDTGFVVNVSEIDAAVRRQAVPVFIQTITEAFSRHRRVSMTDLVGLLERCWGPVQADFAAQTLTRLRLELNPFRSLSIQAEKTAMFTFSEKFEFAAMHRLWNDRLDEWQNDAAFGKCANPAGHGHNYILEVNVQRPAQTDADHWIGDLQQTVRENFLNLVDHKNLNVDVKDFETRIPTVENLAFFAWEKLAGKFKDAKLVTVTVWENDRTHCSYSG